MGVDYSHYAHVCNELEKLQALFEKTKECNHCNVLRAELNEIKLKMEVLMQNMEVTRENEENVAGNSDVMAKKAKKKGKE